MVNLDKIFYPDSVCIIGVSDNILKGATPYLYALRTVNFDKPIYCVSKNRKKVLYDMDAYPSVLDVPEEIDYAIIGVPNQDVPQAVLECSQKGVKFCAVFTAGFSELGTEEGTNLEAEIVKNAQNGLRVVGPNCLGVYCQESRVTVTEIFNIQEREGEVAFISQSGGHTGSYFFVGESRGFPFNKMVSIGNQCDLTIQDFIEYFADDPKINVISCYIEQVKEVKNFLKVLNETTRMKPVVFYKGGQTEEGRIAAASHTGAVSSSYDIFKSAINQHGGIVADSMEELSDLTLGSLFLARKKLGPRLGIMVPGGGSCVEMTDQATRFHLQVPELSPSTQEYIQQRIQKVNTSTRNPVDLGMFGWFPQIFADTIQAIAEDPYTDIVIFYFMTERLPTFSERMLNKHLGKHFLKGISKVVKKLTKPFICIIPNFDITSEKIAKMRKQFVVGLTELGVPYFESMERAANVIHKILRYQNFRDQ